MEEDEVASDINEKADLPEDKPCTTKPNNGVYSARSKLPVMRAAAIITRPMARTGAVSQKDAPQSPRTAGSAQ